MRTVWTLEPYGTLKHQRVEMASTPSDHRASANVLADLRRKDNEDNVLKALPVGKDGNAVRLNDEGWKRRALEQAYADLKAAEAGGARCVGCKQELALFRARITECEYILCILD